MPCKLYRSHVWCSALVDQSAESQPTKLVKWEFETVFSMIKGKFGDAVRSKSNEGQINEVLCKVLCHNICVLIQSLHELAIEPTFWAEKAVAQEVPAFA